MNTNTEIKEENQTKHLAVSGHVEPVVSTQALKSTVFDLMFHGCQQLTKSMTLSIIDKIKQGKIRGIKMEDGYLD